ncbi:N-acetyllactosaminide 3-alpha-galactosyltransferase [Ancylostoma duodenale]|uniref:N-acetyllactosaminide 3-alpha-galactosyltransferase n=1 Tax=Ancylostoma duodenale TaxID=51022 RepID=A0A0C2D2R8_9BILA|nr:N-acetyllactosaminide 3-alpha-galactosyltransferase [Ancylostoma duodenale]
MAVAMNKFGYKIPYATMFGTSTALTVEQFRRVNGFSNRYWGWGGEDDDMYTRVVTAGYDVDRYPENIARYTMIKHGMEPKSNPVNPCRHNLMELTTRDWQKDGLSNLAYKIIRITHKKLYTHILVDLLENEERPLLELMIPYATMFGTSTVLTVEQFRRVNGFSNRYWGWGGEDDDMYTRVVTAGYDVDRYPENIARYTMIKHGMEPKSNPVNPCRYNLMELTTRDWQKDGLSNLAYKIVRITNKKLYTHILVDLLENEERPLLELMFC